MILLPQSELHSCTSSELSTVTTVQNTMKMPFILIIHAKTQQQKNMLNETQNRQTGGDKKLKSLDFKQTYNSLQLEN